MKDDDLQEILDRIDLESFFDQEGVDYKVTRGRSGVQLNVKTCPVCGNSASKVYLNVESGLGNCFAGDHPPGEHFNKWKFIRALWSELGTQQVIFKLKEIARTTGWKPKKTETLAPVSSTHEWSVPAHIELPYAGKNLAYLQNRGITLETVKKFGLSYCQEGYFRYQLRGNWKFMDFSKSVLIPIYDLDLRLVTFQGRDISGLRNPKYLFPPGLTGAGVHLYNGFRAMTGGVRDVVIGEGAFDVMALDQALQSDSKTQHIVPIGTFGKHLSIGSGDTQGEKLRRLYAAGVRNLTFMWDGEVGATDAAVISAKLCRDMGFHVRIAMLPADKDPNEVSPEIVRDAYFSAEPFSMLKAPLIMIKRRQMNQSVSKSKLELA